MLFSVMGICSHSLTSCSSDDDGGGPKKTALENEFSYNNETTPIGSVVYTKDDASGIYTFYISPTEGLIDLDAMLLADDYILIATNTPTGDIDLTGKDNSLVYKNVKISSETAANVQNSALSLLLTSQTTVKLSLDAAMTSGETLKAEYNGLASSTRARPSRAMLSRWTSRCSDTGEARPLREQTTISSVSPMWIS